MNPKRRCRFALLDNRAAVLVAMVSVLLSGLIGSVAADELKIGGTGAALGTMRLLANEYSAKSPGFRIRIVPSLGSGGSIKAVLAGAIDLAVSSRPINEQERKLGASLREFGRTPFVVAVAAKMPIDTITIKELADIYAGIKVKWPDGTPIRIILRPSSDIDSEMIRSFSPALRQGVSAAEARPGIRVALNDQMAADDLERIPGAVGPSSLSLLLSEKRQLKALSLDGVRPTPENAASQAYPYSKRLFFVTGARLSKAVESFTAFANSPAGRKILVANGIWLP